MKLNITYFPFKIFVLFFVFLFIHNSLSAQTVKGVVTDSNSGQPILGVTILQTGTVNGTSTNIDGRYILKLKETGAKSITISYVGYKTTIQDVANEQAEIINVKLEEDVGQLKEVVIQAGYGTIKKDLSTGSVSSITGEELADLPATTVIEALQGRIAGLNILGTSGEPGAPGIITIRGNTSLSLDGRSQPLYVIDGVIMDPEVSGAASAGINPLALLNPNDIKSIDVLKDAASSTIYGARGANGVIIVTTKRATSSEPQITLRHETGISTRPALRNVIVGAAERRLKMRYLLNNLSYEEKRAQISLMLTDSLNTAFNNNTDWQDLVIQTAVTNEYAVAVSGRTENADYRLSISSYDEEGIIKNTGFSRISGNLLYNFRISEKLRINTNLSYSSIERKQGNGDYIFRFTGSNFPSSFWQLTETEREFHTGASDNVRNKNDFYSFGGNLNVQYDIVKGLKFTSNLVTNFNYLRTDRYQPASVTFDGISNALSTNEDNRYTSLENYFSYTSNFNGDKHNLSAVVGQSVESQYIAGTRASARDIPVDAIKNIQGIPDINTNVQTYNRERSLASFFSRISYDYDNKYLISANYRADGSSRFGKENRWAYFPSLSAGWILTNENFFPETDIVSFLKIRGSYGISGREPGNFYQSYQSLTGNLTYFNGTSVQSYGGAGYIVPDYQGLVSSPKLGWEKAKQTNIGLDIRLFNDRLSITGEYYHRYTEGLLYNLPIPAVTGYNTALANSVDVLNKGWELTVGASVIRTTNFNWQSNLTLASNENIVAKTPGGKDITVFGWWNLSQGQPLYNYRVYETDGVYKTTADVPVDPLTGQRIRMFYSGGPQFEGGDPKRVDQNNDYIIDSNDFVSKGSSDPKLFGGWNNNFSYKQFSVNIMVNFVAGRKILNGYLSDKLNSASRVAGLSWGGLSGPASDLGEYTFWENPGDVADLPRITPNNVDQWGIQSSYFVEDGSFVKIKFVNFGYSLPDKFSKTLGLSSGRIWGGLNNLYTWTKSTLTDPEAVSPSGYASAQAYPVPTKFSFGIEVSF